MAALSTDAPDPKVFQSWEDAFRYPVSATRRMEQQLRNDISGNRERLRTLVGTSYRELLGTAESIVHMDKQMRDAEDYLSSISQMCNTRILEKAKSSTIRISKQSRISSFIDNVHASHLAMLQQCPGVIISLMRSGQSLQLAAKILVLSRHLHKKASQESSTAPFVEVLRLRLVKIRMKLLSLVNRRLANPSLSSSSIIDAMAAYSLATNSSCADNLRHFLHVRLGAISARFQNEDSASREAIRGLELWIKTMQDTQALFPRQVSNALAKVKSKPLLQEESILDIDELDFDTHGLFIDDDIKYFTPYIRHDDLNVSTAAQLLSSWSPIALRAYVNSLSIILDNVEHFPALLILRKECLHMWVSSKGRTVGVTKSECLDTLRRIFQEHLSKKINNQAKSINDVVEAIQSSLICSDFPAQTSRSLWSDDLVHAELYNGAQRLTDGVRARVHGASAKHDEILKAYTTWLNKMNSTRVAILELKSKKWTIEELDDDEEDIEDIEDMRYRLEKEDPVELDTELQAALISSGETLRNEVDSQCSQFMNKSDARDKAIFVLRLLREIKQTTPDGVDPQDISFPFVVKLQRTIAKPIAQALIQEHGASISAAITQIKVPVRLLWDGTPESPIVPSPWSFRLLRSLHQRMSAIGVDIWTSHAVGELQNILRKALADKVQNSTSLGKEADQETRQASKINGSEHSSEHSDENDAKIQLLFDVSYIRAALSTHLSEEEEEEEEQDLLKIYCKTISEEVELSEERSTRVVTAATEYWKRTSLLFGLLA